MDPDAKFMLRFAPLAGALGCFIERLVFFMAESQKLHESFGQYFLAQVSILWAYVAVGAAVSVVSLVILDVNRQNRLKMLVTAFLLGAVWQGAWVNILKLGTNIIDASK